MLLSIRILKKHMPPRKRVKHSSDDDNDSDFENPNCKEGTVDESEDVKDAVVDWRDKLRGLREINGHALQNNTLSDVTLKVGYEEIPMPAHRLILAMASPVFEAMFFGGLAERGETVSIPDISPDGFSCLLRYIYTEDVSFKNEVEAFRTCSAADKYCLPHLKEECEKYLFKCHLTPDNVWIFLENSLFMDLKTISEKCLECLKRNTMQALQVSSFLETTPDAIENVLKLDTLEVKELVLLESIVRWAEHRATRNISFQVLLDPLLGLIRFGALTPCEFCTFLEDRPGLIEDTDALSILKHLIKPLSSPLPEWCCIKTWRSNQSDYESGSSDIPKFCERRSRSRSPKRSLTDSFKQYLKRELVASRNLSSETTTSDSSSDDSSYDYDGYI